MSDNSKIEWTDSTWNFVRGCTRISDGCLHCYIDSTPPFRMSGNRFDSPAVGGKTRISLHPDKLEDPLSWRKPRRVFVNSLSDLFHEDVPESLIAKAFAVMAATPQHSYQILTKRPARMRFLMTSAEFVEASEREFMGLTVDRHPRLARTSWSWPVPGVWLGVSTEDQRWADVRIPMLLETPAAVRFISAEPLLGPVDLRHLSVRNRTVDCLGGDVSNARGEVFTGTPSVLDWVIVGGESGRGARSMDTSWAASIVKQCASAHAQVFVKQLGSVWAQAHGAAHPKGGDAGEWPAELRVRQFPALGPALLAATS
jgi:protein gp37